MYMGRSRALGLRCRLLCGLEFVLDLGLADFVVEVQGQLSGS